MPITKEIQLFQYEELSESAKETAREWWLSCRDASDLESVIEDFQRICDALGIELQTRPVKLMSGATRTEPDVSWSLGYSQSDFAAYQATYRHKAGATKAIKAYAPKDKELHRIAAELSKAQRRHGFNLWAEATYHHYYGQQIEVFNGEGFKPVCDESFTGIKEALKALARWLYNALRTEDEWQSENEQIADAMAANEYTFREDGRREDA